jgi:hypothetical protein
LGQRVKVRLGLPTGSFRCETVWAEHVADSLYRLLNAPFFASGIAEGDIVRCVRMDGWLTVEGVERDSGNGTLWLLLSDAENPSAQHIIDELVSVGCSYERGTARLIAVTVPIDLQIPFSQLANYLNAADRRVLVVSHRDYDG